MSWNPGHRPKATTVGKLTGGFRRQQEGVFLTDEEDTGKSSHYSPLSSSELLSIVSPDGASAYFVGDSGSFSSADVFRKVLGKVDF